MKIMNKLEINHNSNYDFELVLQVRDNLGNPTKKKKYIKANSGSELAKEYNKHCHFEYTSKGVYKVKGRKKRKRK